MKRTIEEIDNFKWYHLETLKKYYSKFNIKNFNHSNDNGVQFEFISFTKLFTVYDFVVHPKTKRLRRITNEALKEIGYV